MQQFNIDKMKARSLFVAMFAFSLVLMVSCKKDEVKKEIESYGNTPTPEHPIVDSTEVEHTNLVAIIDSAFYEPNSFVSAVEENCLIAGIPQLKALCSPFFNISQNRNIPILNDIFAQELSSSTNKEWVFATFSFKYNSISSFGEPIVLSARVTFPNNVVADVDHKVSSLSLICHQAPMSKYNIPSAELSMPDMRAFFNSAVIEPDFQGYGCDYMQHIFPWFCRDVIAQQMADCITAAQTIMNCHGVALADDGYSTLWGTSLGAASALYFAHYYDNFASQKLRDALRLQSVFVGEGPLSPANQLYDANYHGFDLTHMSTMVFLPYIHDIPAQSFHGLTYLDFVNPLLTAQVVPCERGYCSYLEGQAWSVSARKQYAPEEFKSQPYVCSFTADMRTADGMHLDTTAEKTQLFFSTLRTLCSVEGWAPQHDLYIAENPADEAILYNSVKAVYNTLRQYSIGNSKVHWLDVSPNAPRFTSIIDEHQLTATIMLIYLSVMRDPKDLATVYTEE